MPVTITYEPEANGWTSFHSFTPQWMIGMNNRFYSFYQGTPWQHYNNNTRNSYYGAPTAASSVTFVINESPVEAKMFKTIELEGNKAWKCEMVSDLHEGLMEAEYFVPKEGSFYANSRRTIEGGATYDFSQISTQGLGYWASFSTAATTLTITFNVPSNITLNPIVSVGDTAYEQSSANGVTVLGPITAITRNTIEIDPFVATPTPPWNPPENNLIFATKNSVAESYGLRGHYNEVTLTNSDSDLTELFAVSSEIFKSYP